MREKYESLSAVVLRDLAKARGLKNISGMKKSDLVDLMVAESSRQTHQESGAPPQQGKPRFHEHHRQCCRQIERRQRVHHNDIG